MLDVETIGAEENARNVEAFMRFGLPAVVKKAMRTQIEKTTAKAKREMRTQSAFGRRLWNRKPSDLNELVTVIDRKVAGADVEVGIGLKGIPKLMEQGGTIRRHDIEGKPYMVFKGKAGNLIFAKHVNHPGGPVRRHETAQKALERDTPLIVAEIEKGTDKLIGDTFGKSA